MCSSYSILAYDNNFQNLALQKKVFMENIGDTVSLRPVLLLRKAVKYGGHLVQSIVQSQQDRSDCLGPSLCWFWKSQRTFHWLFELTFPMLNHTFQIFWFSFCIYLEFPLLHLVTVVSSPFAFHLQKDSIFSTSFVYWELTLQLFLLIVCFFVLFCFFCCLSWNSELWSPLCSKPQTGICLT